MKFLTTSYFRYTTLLIFTVFFTGTLDAQLYVNHAATGANNGSSWADAYTDLQSALDAAVSSQEVLIAEGTYKPTESPDGTTANSRDRAFHFDTDLIIKGGYDPSTGTPTGNATILSGDIGSVNDPSDNVYHIMINTGLTPATVIEGLTFRDGNANGSSDNDLLYGGTTFDRRFGGGIYNKSSDPIYTNCVFTNNNATVNGGGLYITVSDATVNDCLFSLNTADSGGGLGNSSNSTSIISRSVFDSNMALSLGGGVANVASSQSTLTNCVFIENSAMDGGGVANSGTSTDILNCTLISNSATSSARSIFASSTTNITNTIAWANGSEIAGASATVSNSIIQGGYIGCVNCPSSNGNIDPLFVDAADADGPDNILGTADDGISLGVASPAINTGNPTDSPSEDITGASRIGIVDIGAYEGQCQAELVYVNINAVGNGNGLSWTDAYTDLQDALDQAMICGVDSILVAEGTYFPSSSPDESSENPRDRSFHFNKDVVIKGGYDASTGTQTGSATIFSGDIGTTNNASDNVFHIMVNTGLTPATILENLTFRDGNANGPPVDDMEFGGTTFDRQYGGGIYNKSSDPIYANCVFTNNNATLNGGGLYITSSDAIVNDCLFSSNSAANGGGLGNAFGSTSIVSRSIFDSNMASSEGGGMANVNSSESTLSNCVFINNSAVDGGGISNTGTSTAIINCTLTTNSASNSAGAILASSTTNITNTIAWGNGSEIAGASGTVSNSIIQGGYTPCTNCPNTDGNKDPLFVDAGDPDGLDDILGTADDGISLGVVSPAINTGNPTGAPSEDITGVSRLGIVDIGAYEGQCQAELVYVNINAVGSGNGLSWTDAYTDLQDALDQAMDCGVDSILVAEGTYYPSASPDDVSTDPIDRAFHLNTNVVVKGGYDPSTGMQNGGETILSGDIGVLGNASDNAIHVMITTGLDDTAEFEQLSFRDGNAIGGTIFERSVGGGMYNNSSSPTLTSCTFTSNSAANFGGGMFNNSSSPTLTNCTFTFNKSLSGGGMYNYSSSYPTLTNCTFTFNNGRNGGGMYNYLSSSPTLNNSTFTSNSASNLGGGMMNESNSTPTLNTCTFTFNNGRNGGGILNRNNSSPTLNNSIFTSNSASNLGGGMHNENASSPTLNTCTFQLNSSTVAGGAMYNISSSPILTGCTFTSNSSDDIGGAIRNNANSPELTNCIFTSNTALRGGGMANNNCSVLLTDCTFYVPASNIGILNEAAATTTIIGTVEIINNYVSDNEGNAYKTVKIGNQTWMAENLNLGTMINGLETQTDNATIEKYCYDNDPVNCDIYGGLYQWDEMMQYATAESSQGLCPSGWHLPSDDEWQTLEMSLGMTQAEAEMQLNRGTDQGSQLAGNESLWADGALVQNPAFGLSGFAAVPAGTLSSSFSSQFYIARIWSSSSVTNQGKSRDLAVTTPTISISFPSKSNGNSVRCVQD